MLEILNRKFSSYPITDFYHFKTQLLNYAKRFSNFCFLDNHEYNFDRSIECIAGLGSIKSLTSSQNSSLTDIDHFIDGKNDWIFSHISYDLKNRIEELESNNKDEIGFADFHFFIPETVFILSKNVVEIGITGNENSDAIFESVIAEKFIPQQFVKPILQSTFSHTEYLDTVAKLQKHIARGDCYEICFCEEFYAKEATVDPLKIYLQLSQLSPNPFSAFYGNDHKYLMCASPERFLKKVNDQIISQPIKGTAKRINIEEESEEEKNDLLHNEKERAENIMIVDLVRNDLSKICEEGSVGVKEFLKIYSFPQVHQMISTIEGTLRKSILFSEILKATFPMGSMTGAPKKRAMELIEQYEKTKRGLFSGTIGYINPAGDFDFNVVIRSILYNQQKKYLSVSAGSAITWKSIPQKEYEECNIKIEAMKKALE